MEATKMPIIPLPSIARSPAKRGSRTYHPLRKLKHEQEDRATSTLLNTFSAHSTILGVIEFIETILRHHQRLGTDLTTQQRIQSAIARFKLGATYVIPSRKGPPQLKVGSWARGLLPATLQQALMFTGKTFFVMSGGRLNPKIVAHVCMLMRIEYDPNQRGVFYCVTEHCVAHDAVFEMTLEWNRRMKAADAVIEEVSDDELEE
ncbi:hypothetical protein CKM354_001293400 [Cercospora kikuchii]|uniref:Uncharacterized protein n=1 Tax=Cercospora kikuchii TaxID=84275 RepID=A0A9P3L392_9PEZI|nr:uncharacterized protein CKM354_001293400 [Cercospora kikuchii]GIZ49917.1 hypothetical protein CKM354_001293400 [Cercospora kikuchii]